MVVIAIIALVTAIIVRNLSSSRTKARDAERISDIGHIQLALELYYDKCRQYPIPGSSNEVNISASNCAGTAVLSDYISKIPTPPGPSTKYDYYVDSSSLPTDYILHIQLENVNYDVQKDSFPETSKPSWASSISCYNGAVDGSNKEYCLSPK